MGSDRRIPNTSSQSEVRNAFQRFDADVETLEGGTVSIDVIAAEGSLIVKDSDATGKSYVEFSQGTDNQVLVSAGVGVNPVWTTDLDGLTSIVCDNITIDGATILSDTGAIGFGDENLTTTGNISIVSDVSALQFGASTDATIRYDASNLEYTIVTSGSHSFIGGDVHVDFARSGHKLKIRNPANTWAREGVLGFGYASIPFISIKDQDNKSGTPFGAFTTGSVGACVEIQKITGNGYLIGMHTTAIDSTIRAFMNHTAGNNRNASVSGIDLEMAANGQPTVGSDLYSWSGIKAQFTYTGSPTVNHTAYGGYFTADVSGSNANARAIGFYASAVEFGGGRTSYAVYSDGNAYIDGDTTVTGTLIVDTMTIAGGSITDSSGAISFGDENLTTTGTLASGIATVDATLILASGSITDSSGAISFGDENLTTDGTITSGGLLAKVGGTIDIGDNLNPFDDIYGKKIHAKEQLVITAGTVTGNLIPTTDLMYTIGENSTPKRWNEAYVGTTLISGATITNSTGAISFGDENLTTTGTVTGESVTIFSPTPILVFKDSNSLGAASVGFIEWRDSGGGRAGFFGNSSSGNDDLVWKNEQGGNIVIQTTGAGECQIFANVDLGSNDFITTGTLGAGATTVTSLTDGTATLTGGSLTVVKLGSLTTNGLVQTTGSDGTLSIDTSIYLTTEADTLDTVADRGSTTDQTLTAGGFVTGTLVLAAGSITDSSGAISFGNENLSTTGTMVGSNIPAPTVTDKVLTSTGANTATWQDTVPGHAMPSAAYEIFVGTGAGTAAWTTDIIGLTILTVDNISINGAAITSDTGAISFGNENLSTTGTMVGSNIPAPTIDDQVLISTASGIASWSTAGNYQILASGVTGEVAWENKPFGYFIASPFLSGQVYVATGAGTASWTTSLMSLTYLKVDNIAIDGAVITSDSGAISFGDENLSTTGKGGFGSTSVYVNSHVEVVGQHTANKYHSALHIRTTGTTYGAFIGSSASGRSIWSTGAHFANGDWLARGTTASGIYQNFGNILFYTDTGLTDGVEYTPTQRGLFDSSGLNVTGTVVGSNIPSPTGDSQVLVSTSADNASWNTSCMSDAIETAPAAGNEDKVLIADSSGDLQFQDPIWARLLASNETIFVRTATGNDANDGESSGTALLTIQEGINRLYRRVANGYTITMDIGEGVYTLGAAISPAYPYGYNVEWKGSSESHVSCTVSNIGSVTASGLSGLSYLDFDITLPATKVASVGDFISVTAAAGGANPHLAMGSHEVTAIAGTPSGNVATVRMYRRTGPTDVPTTSAVLSVTVIKTVLDFTGSNGLKLNGAFHSGTWGNTGYGICFKGSHAYNGIWALNGASIILGNDGATSGWATNLYAQNGALIYADYTCHAKTDGDIVKCQNGATINLRYGSVLTGGKSRGAQVFIGGTLAFNQGHIYLTGANFGIQCHQGGIVDFSNGTVKHGHASSYALSASTGGRIDAASATISDYTLEINNSEGRGAIYDGNEGTVYGEIYAFDAALTHTISGMGIGNKVQVTAFNANGHSHRLTPNHSSDDITMDIAGDYMCTVSMNIESVAGGAQTVGTAVYKNNGATLFSNLHMHRKLSGGGGDLGAVSLNGIIDLVVNDTVEVWIWNSTTGDIIVDDVTLTLVRIGR